MTSEKTKLFCEFPFSLIWAHRQSCSRLPHNINIFERNGFHWITAKFWNFYYVPIYSMRAISTNYFRRLSHQNTASRTSHTILFGYGEPSECMMRVRKHNKSMQVWQEKDCVEMIIFGYLDYCATSFLSNMNFLFLYFIWLLHCNEMLCVVKLWSLGRFCIQLTSPPSYNFAVEPFDERQISFLEVLAQWDHFLSHSPHPLDRFTLHSSLSCILRDVANGKSNR